MKIHPTLIGVALTLLSLASTGSGAEQALISDGTLPLMVGEAIGANQRTQDTVLAITRSTAVRNPNQQFDCRLGRPSQVKQFVSQRAQFKVGQKSYKLERICFNTNNKKLKITGANRTEDIELTGVLGTTQNSQSTLNGVIKNSQASSNRTMRIKLKQQ